MLEDKIIFLEKPFFVDNAELVAVARFLIDSILIIEKLEEFATQKIAQEKQEGYDSEDCNNCQKKIFEVRNIDEQDFLLIRAGCLIRERLKMDEIIYFIEKLVS